jgi:DNA-binding CsgD family transcriptional regulator
MVHRNGLKLTQKQRETIELLSTGYTSKHIAAKFEISPQAVDRRVQGLLRKTGYSNRGELIRWHQQQAGLSSAAETNLCTPSDAAPSSISERFTTGLDVSVRFPEHHALTRPAVDIYPERQLSGVRTKARIEWLGMEITWLQALLALIALKDLYEIIG